jgi:hypothetical protein
MKNFLRLSAVLRRSAAALCVGGCLLSAVAAPATTAAPTELAPGLRYLRIHSLVQSAAELSEALNVNKSQALVIDLRYIADEKGAAQAINALNSQPAKPMLYILVSPGTPEEVAATITHASPKRVTLGIKGAQPTPDVIVAQSADDDRRAYAALDQGTPLATLVSGKLEKDHFDEAELVKEFKSGNHDAHPPEGDPDSTAAAPARLTDRVLQRALHLYLAQQALKR